MSRFPSFRKRYLALSEKIKDTLPHMPEAVSQELQRICDQLAALVSMCDNPQEVLAWFNAALLSSLDEQSKEALTSSNGSLPKLTPELLAWARRQFTDEEFAAGLRDIRETGGVELSEFIHDLEQETDSDA